MSDTMETGVDSGWVEPVIPDSAWEGAVDEPDDVDDAPDAGYDESDSDAAPTDRAEPETPAETPKAEDPVDPLVHRLNEENMQRRLALKPYEEAFQGYDEQAKQALLSLARDLVENPAAAAARMEAYAANIRQDPQYAPETTPATIADVERRLAEREQMYAQQQAQAEQQRLASEVEGKIRGYGIEPMSVQGQTLILKAMLEHNNDLEAAHAAQKAEREAIEKAAVDAYLAKRKADARGPKPETGGGAAPSGSSEGPKTIDDAMRAAMAASRIE